MQQQWPQDENVACLRRAGYVLLEWNGRDLAARHDTIEVAPRNDAKGSAVTVRRVEVNTKRDELS
jgi:hypothetical protein